MSQSNRRLSRPGLPGQRQSGSEGGRKGSPEPEFLVVGRIIRPHGIRGDLAMKVLTDYPERLPDRKTLYLGPSFQPYQVARVRPHRDGVIIQFEGIRTRDTAETLRDMLVHVHIDDAVPLEEDEYYQFQIYGLRVETEDGQILGELTDILETGANDVYVVTNQQGIEILLPVIPEVIRKVDVDEGVIIVTLLDGLL
jgi:16S rRNA processing protein RimM